MIKLPIFLFLMLLFVNVDAQLIKGRIINEQTKRPIEGISIKLKYSSKISSVTGDFSLLVLPADTVWFSGVGYSPKYVIAANWEQPLMIISLKPVIVDLKEVVISGHRNYEKDSIQLRKDFGREFNYKQIGIKDVFINSSSSRGRFEFVKIDVLQLVGFLGRKNNVQNKLKKRLNEDEKQRYIDSRFDKVFVGTVTKLANDSLELFMERYRPNKEELLELSDYNLILKIKDDLNRFKKGSK